MPLSMAIKQRAVRGATLNRESTRFNLPQTHEDGDWLDARAAIDGAPPPPRTTVTIEKPKTILTFNASPDIGLDRSVNPYRGCEHGCIYCVARPSHASRSEERRVGRECVSRCKSRWSLDTSQKK